MARKHILVESQGCMGSSAPGWSKEVLYDSYMNTSLSCVAKPPSGVQVNEEVIPSASALNGGRGHRIFSNSLHFSTSVWQPYFGQSMSVPETFRRIKGTQTHCIYIWNNLSSLNPSPTCQLLLSWYRALSSFTQPGTVPPFEKWGSGQRTSQGSGRHEPSLGPSPGHAAWHHGHWVMESWPFDLAAKAGSPIPWHSSDTRNRPS